MSAEGARGGAFKKYLAPKAPKRGGYQNIAPKALRGGLQKYMVPKAQKGRGYQKNAPQAQTTRGVVKIALMHRMCIVKIYFLYIFFDF